MTTSITRSQIFTLAWERARAKRDWYETIRAAFAASLRRIWEQVKALNMVEAEQKARPVVVRPVASDWANGNVHRAAAVARGKARWGHYSPGVRTCCW